MKIKALSIAIACASGSGIGTLLALQFHTLWILGLIIGGVLGYLVYDIPQVLKAVPKAYKYAKGQHFNISWKDILGALRIISQVILVFTIVFILPIGVWMYFDEKHYLSVFFLLMMPFWAVMNAFILIGADASLADYKKIVEDQRGPFVVTRTTWIIKVARKNKLLMIFFIFFAPVAISINILMWLGRILFYIPKAIWDATEFTCNFCWKLFKFIHSDLRLLVGIDSVIGGFAGFLSSNILIGIVAGAVWGFINYYIVSLKILKLKPVH